LGKAAQPLFPLFALLFHFKNDSLLPAYAKYLKVAKEIVFFHKHRFTAEN
jgi:hypothetical protein